MFGRGSRASSKTEGGAVSAPVPVLRVSAWGRVPVVGESHHQSAIKAAAAGRATTLGSKGIATTATLVPDPRNPHDRNAVRVDVGQSAVGYLGRHHAAEYQLALLTITATGHIPSCPARITGGGDRHYGVYLHLAPPDALLFANDPQGLHVLEADDIVTISGSKDCLDVTGAYRPRARIVVVLDFCLMASGKYLGQRVVQATLDGRRIGHLTPAMSQRYTGYISAAYQRGEVPACEGVLQDDGRVQVLMPEEARRQERHAGL